MKIHHINMFEEDEHFVVLLPGADLGEALETGDGLFACFSNIGDAKAASKLIELGDIATDINVACIMDAMGGHEAGPHVLGVCARANKTMSFLGLTTYGDLQKSGPDEGEGTAEADMLDEALESIDGRISSLEKQMAAIRSIQLVNNKIEEALKAA